MTIETDSRRKLYEAFANPKAIAEMTAFARAGEYFRAHYTELLAAYPNSWVVIAEDRVVLRARSLDGVLAKMDAQDISRYGVYISHLDPSPPTIHAPVVRAC